MAKKLAQAIASGKIMVKNVISGECVLSVEGKPVTIGPGQTVDLGAILQNPKDVLRTSNLETVLSSGWLVLV